MPLASPKYPFKSWAAEHAPDDPGVYALYEEERLICLGVAQNRAPGDTIRARLLALCKAPAGHPAARATHYKWEITSRPLEKRDHYLHLLGGRVTLCEEAPRKSAGR